MVNGIKIADNTDGAAERAKEQIFNILFMHFDLLRFTDQSHPNNDQS